MKRRNVQEAFVGEPAGDATGHLDNYADGDEAVDIEVRGGKVQVLVPSGTSDGDLFEKQTFVGGELQLEDGRILSFQIESEAVGAQVGLVSPSSQDRGAGLSGIPNVPSGI